MCIDKDILEWIKLEGNKEKNKQMGDFISCYCCYCIVAPNKD